MNAPYCFEKISDPFLIRIRHLKRGLKAWYGCVESLYQIEMHHILITEGQHLIMVGVPLLWGKAGFQ